MINNTVIEQPCQDTTGYEIFLPRIAAAIMEKVKKEEQLSETETRAIVAMEYKAAIRKLAELTDDYCVEIPIDVYPESRFYPINPPKGFRLSRVIEPLLTDKYEMPKGAVLNGNVLELPCCPDRQVNNAFYANVAVIPMMTCPVCAFDTLFVEKYFELIHMRIMINLTMQPARQWRALGVFRDLQLEFKKELKGSKVRDFTNRKIRLKKERLTDGKYTTPTCAKGSVWA